MTTGPGIVILNQELDHYSIQLLKAQGQNVTF